MRMSPLGATLAVLALPLALLASQPGCADDEVIDNGNGTGTEGGSLVAARSDRGFTLGGDNVDGLEGVGIFRFDAGTLADLHGAFAEASVEMGFGEDGVEVKSGEGMAFAHLAVTFENGVSVCSFDVQRSTVPGLPPGAGFEAACEGTVTNPLSIALTRGASGPLAVTLALRPVGVSGGPWAYSEPLRVSATGGDGADEPRLQIDGRSILLR